MSVQASFSFEMYLIRYRTSSLNISLSFGGVYHLIPGFVFIRHLSLNIGKIEAAYQKVNAPVSKCEVRCLAPSGIFLLT